MYYLNMSYFFRLPYSFTNATELEIFDMTVDAANKNTQAITVELIDKIEKILYRSGKTSLKILDYNVGTQFITFPLTPFDPFYEEFRETILKLIEAGICPFRLNGKMVDRVLRRNRLNENVPPLVLTLEDLGVGFIVCSIPLCLSVAAFLFELLISKIHEIISLTRDYFVAFGIIRAVILPKH